MSFRVQFTISDTELGQLKQRVLDYGYPNVAAFCKAKSLGENSYAELYRELLDKIDKLSTGTEFFLRDLIDTPPALLGKWLYDDTSNGKIKNVTCLGKKGQDPLKYKKVQK